MKLEIEKKEFLKGLGLVQGITGRKTTLPILTHVLMEVQNGSFCLTGTDLEIGIREELTATIHSEGKASVSAKKLYEIVRELPDETIHMQKKENHWIALRCGKSIFNLAGLDAEEFPSLPTFQKESFAKVPALVLGDMIGKTAFAASNEESRYHLNGVFVAQVKKGGKEGIRMVTTDGHRLALVDRWGHSVPGVGKGMIVPKKGVLELRKLIPDKDGGEEMGIYFDGTHGFVQSGRSLMVIRLIDGEFPEYEQVIPKENDKKLTVRRDELYACVRRVSTMTSERLEGVKFSIREQVVELSSYNQDFGDAKEEMEVAYGGPAFEIGFNSRYLLDALSVLETEEVVLELGDEGSPGLFRPVLGGDSINQLCIIMPMRI